MAAADEAATAAQPRALPLRKPAPAPLDLHPVGSQLSPGILLAAVVGVMALGAGVLPWYRAGWQWFELTGAAAFLVAAWDGFGLWRARKEFAPVLLLPEKGLRGREGQLLPLPLALSGRAQLRLRHEVRVCVMPSTQECETAMRVEGDSEELRLAPANTTEGAAEVAPGAALRLWPWHPEVLLLRRGVWPGPRVGIERQSILRLWRLRQWYDSPEPLRIEADLRPGRRQILHSPVYRSLVASAQTPWTGHGREFERLREYQPGDNFSEIAWKATARRGTPVTRLFQWEQKQEIYFVVDQSRASGITLNTGAGHGADAAPARTPRRELDLAVETALVGATVALELGDEFGLVTYADEPKQWLRAGSGQFHLHQFREHLLSVEPLPTSADYEVLFSAIRSRLRRRAYLVLLADLTERSVANSLRRGVGLVRSSHALLMTSILPAHARPAFSPGEDVQAEQDMYAALAGEKENQRLGALARQMRPLNVQLRFVPPEAFLRTAIEGYLEGKREQRL